MHGWTRVRIATVIERIEPDLDFAADQAAKGLLMTFVSRNRERIVILDPNRSRYAYLSSTVPELAHQFWYCDRGDEALRLSQYAPARFYIAHVTLPDMSGFDAIPLLAQLAPNAWFVLIADRYRDDEERRAFQLRRTKYLAPPWDVLWLPRLLTMAQAGTQPTAMDDAALPASYSPAGTSDHPP